MTPDPWFNNFRVVADQRLAADILAQHFALVAMQEPVSVQAYVAPAPTPKPPKPPRRTLSEALRDRWADPEQAEKMRAGHRLAWEARRDAQLAKLGLTLSDVPEYTRIRSKGLSAAEAAQIVIRARTAAPAIVDAQRAEAVRRGVSDHQAYLIAARMSVLGLRTDEYEAYQRLRERGFESEDAARKIKRDRSGGS